MRKQNLIWLLVFSLLLIPMLSAQQGGNQKLLLDFVDGNNFSYFTEAGIEFKFPNGVMEGDEIPVGAILTTGANTTVELRIAPNGTVLKLAAGTSFQVQAVATANRNSNTFSLIAGKVRTIATRGSSYDILTSTTVCGVRGTDFTMSFQEGVKATLVVAKGAVEFAERTASGILNPVLVNAGQFSDFYRSFAPSAFTAEIFEEEFGDMFIPDERLPVELPETVVEETPQEIVEEKPAEPAPAATIAPVVPVTPVAETESPAEPVQAERGSATQSALVKWLQEMLGMEIGAITIGDQVWSKAVIQPRISLGKLRAALYLPVIYQSNLFDPNDWYKPAGNHEWDFGTTIGWKDNTVDALLDATRDLALKIRYLEYGTQMKDKFFFKAGNVNSFTIGNGLIMRNYANDADFPAIRHLGFNIGLDLDSWGFEALTNDLTRPELLGVRLFTRPVSGTKIVAGVSGVADLHPAAVFNSADAGTSASDYGDPVFLGLGFDVGLPIINTSLLGLRLYADMAAMVPIVREDYEFAGKPGEAGFRYDMIYQDGVVRNWGAAGGLMGNILMVDWRLEYRYFTGAFRPAFFDAGYERRRMETVLQYANYLSDPAAINQTTSVMGLYGEGGAKLFKDKLQFNFGYFWPFDITKAADSMIATEDYFKAELLVLDGLVPVVNISGGISYERRNFVPTLIKGNGAGASLFDENTIFSGELVVPIPNTPFLKVAVMFSTSLARDTNGDVISKDNKPVMQPMITLETRLSF